VTSSDTVQLAFRNLAQARLRTALTLGGVAIGIASLAGMMSLGVGLQDQFVGRFMQSGLFDQVTVLPGGGGQLNPLARGRGGAFGRRGRGGFGFPGINPPTAAAMSLDDAAIAAIAALPEVREAYPVIRVPLQAAYGDKSQVTIASGVPMSDNNEGAFQTLAAGAFFADDRDPACMLSLDAAKYFLPDTPDALIGKAITLSYAAAPAADADAKSEDLGAGIQIQRIEMPCPVVGIVDRPAAPAIGGGGVSDVMLPLAMARQIDARIVSGPQTLLNETPRTRTYPSVVVKTRRASSTQDVEDRIKNLGYGAFSINDALQGAKRAFLILDIVLGLIGSIALVVSSLGITNTMVMSILERTREIGVMKAIGATDADVRRIFLVEASAIGVIGGALGVLLGWIVGRAINWGANMYIQNQGGQPGDVFALPLWLIGGALGFSWLVSLLAGSYPASRAARLNPIQALRHD
jgi:putative ABC transport system permease protein